MIQLEDGDSSDGEEVQDESEKIVSVLNLKEFLN